MGYTALVRAGWTYTAGNLVFTGKVGLLARATGSVPPASPSCHRESHKFFDIMKKLPSGKKKNIYIYWKSLLTGSATTRVGKNNPNRLHTLLFIQNKLPTRLSSQ